MYKKLFTVYDFIDYSHEIIISCKTPLLFWKKAFERTVRSIKVVASAYPSFLIISYLPEILVFVATCLQDDDHCNWKRIVLPVYNFNVTFLHSLARATLISAPTIPFFPPVPFSPR